MKRTMAALLFGNAAYPDAFLANPAHDAVDLAGKLQTYRFNTILSTNVGKQEMEQRLKDFKKHLESHEVGLFFFAGHGMQIEGKNYLFALDTDGDDELTAKHSSLSLDLVIDTMAQSKSSTKIVILDACRNNPWERRWNRDATSTSLASVYAPKGTIIGFATSPGEVAKDGRGRNGAYTGALLKHIDEPDTAIETMFKKVRNTLAAETNGKQTSWEHTSLSGDFFFNIRVSRQISEYKEKALADSLLVLDLSRRSHKIIRGLKSYDWYKQNPALGMLTAESVLKMSKTSLFIIGRNIYQAACGGSHSAEDYIKRYVELTTGYSADARKALLDGMLFEVFFDANGAKRQKAKTNCFNELFNLERVAELKPSFNFISEAILSAGFNFLRTPGKGQDLSVSVVTSLDKEENLVVVTAVFVDGRNVLRAGSDGWINNPGKPDYMEVSKDFIEGLISEQLIVPKRLLKVVYTPVEPAGQIGYPVNWIVGSDVS